MTLTHILLFSGLALLLGPLLRRPLRGWILLSGSVIAIYWLQPATPIRNLDFWLPTATLALTAFVWAVTRSQETSNRRQNLLTAAILLGLPLAIGLTRHLPALCCLTPTRPPQTGQVLVGLAIVAALAWILARLSLRRRWLINLFVLLILGLFLILKTPSWSMAASAWLRTRAGQLPELASPLDLRWLGFSYIAFRLLHTLRDRLAGRLPDLSLREFVTFVIFFPAFTAGPIDRAQRFVKDLRADFAFAAPRILAGGERIAVGAFKKFALADTLSLVAMNPSNVTQTTSPLWAWALLYAYTLQIYFDFSGYTDIAIGLGHWLGITLPENFDRPYLKPNLTAFWSSWHITLAQWFRAYFFNPLTRALRASGKIPFPAIILSGQFGAMLLIGLWHGVTWNFVIWGAWHGLGLFIHNRWNNFIRARFPTLDENPSLQRIFAISGTLLTFHYVALGWIWFALPTPALSWQALRTLFGM